MMASQHLTPFRVQIISNTNRHEGWRAFEGAVAPKEKAHFPHSDDTSI